MDKLYYKQDRIKFLNIIEQKKSKYFIVYLNVINFKEIANKQGVFEEEKILKEIIQQIKYLDENTSYKFEGCIYEKDIILTILDSVEEFEVIDFINKIVLKNYSYDLNFRLGYRQVNNPGEAISLIENAKFILRSKKYEINNEVTDQFNLEKDIERYMKIKEGVIYDKENFFYLVYQPKFNVYSKKIESCEVLSRCENGQLGNVFPSEFLPIIKDLNYQYEFDLFVFETMCKEMSDIKQYMKNFSINFSIESLLQVDIVEALLKLTKKYTINPSDITIEILEDLFCEKNSLIYKNIDRLSDYGFNLSIDDFGIGYSSYYRLAAFKFSEIKIPREFLMIEQNNCYKDRKKILPAMIEFCKNLDCQIVSEGVETEQDDKLMKSLGVDYIQGYFYSKPLKKLDLIKFIEKFN